MKSSSIILATTLLAAPALRAQVVPDGTTNTLSNVTNIFPGTVIVGTNGSFTLLVLSNNTLVTNSAHVVIGANTTAKSNEVQLVSPTARLQIGGSTGFRFLLVGSNGASSRLVVSNGAQVVANGGSYIGFGTPTSNNVAVVTGAGSVWSEAGQVSVGQSGVGNQLVVTDGGQVLSGDGRIGSVGSNNLALVTGTGSHWSNQTDFFVGVGGAGNRLLIENGGRLSDGTARIGANSSARSNEVVVTGAGSLWSNRLDLEIGQNGAFNRLVVSNGGWVVSSNATMGVNAIATNNEVLVTGSGSVWSNRLDLTIGSLARGNRMLVNNGATASSAGNGVIGLNAGASSNVALLTDAGSSWLIATNLHVGSNAAFNQFVVSNGAAAYVNGYGFVGTASGSRSNTLTVDGTGSSFTSSTNLLMVGMSVVVPALYVGSEGSFNRMVITNGGFVNSGLGIYIGHTGGSNNEVVVTGSGSRWITPDGYLTLGLSSSSGNRLVITNGGTVEVGNSSYIGYIGGSNNEVVVTGPGSSWTNASELHVGAGRGRLSISNGAVVNAGTNGFFVGLGFSSSNNLAVVDGGTLVMSDPVNMGIMNVVRGTNVLNAGLIDAGRALILTNAQGFFEFNGGTLITRGALISNGANFVVGIAGSTPAVWDVRAGASTHVLNVSLLLGRFSSFNRLLVSDGALLTSGNGFIGLNSNARSNTAIISGPGSRWAMGQLEVGADGTFNSLVVSNGGAVSAVASYLGLGGGNNTALVTGSGSMWSNTGALNVGSLGASNQLVVVDGGAVKSVGATVGGLSNSSNNVVLVTGAGSVWTNGSDLFFGNSGAGNRLVVSNGGSVLSSVVHLGLNASSSNNVAVVTGPGSALTNIALNVGRAGPGNQLVVSNGAVVRISTTYVGAEIVGSNNLVLVTDTGSALYGDLFAGYSGPRNQSVVSNGAVALGNYGVVGFDATSSNNFALVTGSGSVWSNALELHIGLIGSSNQLVASDGATIAAGVGFIGLYPNANRNSAILTNIGTRWLLSSNLYVGSNGVMNRLVVADGARVEGRSGFIGAGTTSSNNLAVVTGPGSVWSNAGDFFVGLSGAGNQLVVSNGALLASSSNAWLGLSATSRSNVALVTGAGTIWSNGQTLLVGESGSGNRLTVSDGARIQSKFGWIGLFSSATNNEVVVTGPGSFWETEQDLNIGGLGSGNRLVITNGGSVRNNSGAGIGTALSVSNQVVVTGAGSSWSLGSLLFVGQVASGCRLVISNGGTVFQEAFGLVVGNNSSSTNNRIEVDGGTLLVTNAISGKFDLRRGTTVLNAGLIEVTQLLLTNSQGFLQFNGGTFSTRNSRVSHGTLFDIGNGTSPATFILAGNGLHEFTGILAARVSSNATFTGNGTIGGVVPLQFRAGSRLVPGTSVGKMIFSNSPALQGTIVLEISKTGATLTNDQIQVIAPLTYGGSLVVSNLGPAALTAGDRCPLFSASSFAGAFTNMILPPLSPGLGWTNKLLVDGSIEVIGLKFTQIGLVGGSLLLSGTGGSPNSPYTILATTNIAQPLSNWDNFGTHQFDSSGQFSFSYGIDPGEPQRYFRIRTP